MNEIIRYAWSKSSLGEFLIAVSGKGLVAFEFGGRRATKDDALRARFPEAGIIADQDSLVDILGRIHDVIEQPQSDPGTPLDLRGTPYEVRVWSMLRDIPAGSTTSYGALAAQLGTRDAREVTEAATRAVMTWRRHAPKRQCATIRLSC